MNEPFRDYTHSEKLVEWLKPGSPLIIKEKIYIYLKIRENLWDSKENKNKKLEKNFKIVD